MRWGEWHTVLLLTLCGAALRFWHLGAQSLWLDELFSVSLARRGLAEIIGGTMQDTMPPLYYLLLHWPLTIAADEVAARWLSALFSSAAVPLLYLLARRLFASRGIALTAAALAAFSPFQIAYGQEARMYAQLALFQLAGAYFFARGWSGNRRRDWLAFAFCETFALYSHSLAVLGLLALDLFALWHWRELRERARRLLGAHVAMALLFAPWLAVEAQQTARVLSSFWTPSSSVLNLLRTVYVLNFNTALPAAVMPLGLLVTLLLSALALSSALRAIRLEHLTERDRIALELVLVLACVPPLALFTISLVRPLYVERVLISSSFGLFLLWSWAWVSRPRRLDRALAIAGAVLILVALANYYGNPDSQKPPMRAAAAELAARRQPDEAVLHTSDWTALAFAYYLPGTPQHFLAGDPAYAQETTRRNSGLIAGLVPEDASAVIEPGSRFWLVTALEHSEAYQQQKLDEFCTRFRRIDAVEVERIYLTEFEAP